MDHVCVIWARASSMYSNTVAPAQRPKSCTIHTAHPVRARDLAPDLLGELPLTSHWRTTDQELIITPFDGRSPAPSGNSGKSIAASESKSMSNTSLMAASWRRTEQGPHE